MSIFIQQIEAALLPTATRYAPEGTESKGNAAIGELDEVRVKIAALLGMS